MTTKKQLFVGPSVHMPLNDMSDFVLIGDVTYRYATGSKGMDAGTTIIGIAFAPGKDGDQALQNVFRDPQGRPHRFRIFDGATSECSGVITHYGYLMDDGSFGITISQTSPWM